AEKGSATGSGRPGGGGVTYAGAGTDGLLVERGRFGPSRWGRVGGVVSQPLPRGGKGRRNCPHNVFLHTFCFRTPLREADKLGTSTTLVDTLTTGMVGSGFLGNEMVTVVAVVGGPGGGGR